MFVDRKSADCILLAESPNCKQEPNHRLRSMPWVAQLTLKIQFVTGAAGHKQSCLGRIKPEHELK
ncbi:MAG: hypothetical protein CBE00_14145 [Planctomycetaceae bacterium TMED240]|nr:hypothetical protein [Rhodopirellula sp.]OUX03560.1 MAG: hypothetical protein CBE00_14145 [Planctomycetaceae bacterium TMED240]